MPEDFLVRGPNGLTVHTGDKPLTVPVGSGTYYVREISPESPGVLVGATIPVSTSGTPPELSYDTTQGIQTFASSSFFTGDVLDYTLVDAPTGYSIDSQTGLITIDTHNAVTVDLTVQAQNTVNNVVYTAQQVFPVTVDQGQVPPSFVGSPSISPSNPVVGTEVTLELGSASGTPNPALSVLSLTLDGADVSGSIVNDGGALRFTPATEGVLILEAVADNGVSPTATATAQTTVTAAGASIVPRFIDEPRIHLQGDFRNSSIPVGSTVTVDPGTWYGAGETPVVDAVLYRNGVSVSLTSSGSVYEFVADEPGVGVFEITATTSAGAKTYWLACEFTSSNVTFGQYTPVSGAAYDTNDHPSGPLTAGTYGEFVVDGAGVMTPSTTPLTPGQVTHGGIVIDVVRNALSCSNTVELATAFNLDSATPAASGGKSGLHIMLRPLPNDGVHELVNQTDRHGKFVWHSGLPVTFGRADYSADTVFGEFGIGQPNGSNPPTQGKCLVVGIRFFKHTTTRIEASGTNWMNQYDSYNAWNLNPLNIVDANVRDDNWVEDIGFFGCTCASDLEDLSVTDPQPDLPFQEMGGFSFQKVRRAFLVNCTAERLFNGYGLGGHEVYMLGCEQRLSHGDMVRPRPITIIGGGNLASADLLVKDCIWHESSGDNFRHPDGIHAFSGVTVKGWEFCVFRGNRIVADIRTLRQPPKTTGLYGTILWQAPQTGSVNLPIQNAAGWLINDRTGASTVTLRSLDDFPMAPGINGYYGAGSNRVQMAKSDDDWQVGDTFVYNGTTHTLVSVDSGGTWTISPNLTAGTTGFGQLDSNSRMSQGAFLTDDVSIGDTTIAITVPYGSFQVGDTFSFGTVNYRIDSIPAGGGSGNYGITPSIQAAVSAGTVLGYNIQFTVQRYGAVGSGITINAASGEDFLYTPSGSPASDVSSINVPGNWGEVYFRLDKNSKQFLANQGGNTAYQGIFSGIDPSLGYNDTVIEFNLLSTPGKGIEMGYDSRPSLRSVMVSNAGIYPWPGDVDGDGVANTVSDGKKLAQPAAKMSVGGLSENVPGFRVMSNIGGTQSITRLTSDGGSIDLSEVGIVLGETTAKVLDYGTMANVFAGADDPVNEVFLPDASNIVSQLRPVSGGLADSKGCGCLGVTPADDLYDFDTGRVTQRTPWFVTGLSEGPDLDRVTLSWFDPGYLERVHMFGASYPITGMEYRYSINGGTQTPATSISPSTVDINGQSYSQYSHTITGLTPGDSILFEARASNAFGQGKWTPLTTQARSRRSIPRAVIGSSFSLDIQSAPDRALVLTASHVNAAALTDFGQLTLNGQTFDPVVEASVANRGAAVYVLRESDLAGMSGTVTGSIAYTSNEPTTPEIQWVFLTGVDQSAAIVSGSDVPNNAQTMALVDTGDGVSVSVAVSNSTLAETGDGEIIQSTDATGGLSLLIFHEGSDTHNISTTTGASYGILAGVRIPLVGEGGGGPVASANLVPSAAREDNTATGWTSSDGATVTPTTWNSEGSGGRSLTYASVPVTPGDLVQYTFEFSNETNPTNVSRNYCWTRMEFKGPGVSVDRQARLNPVASSSDNVTAGVTVLDFEDLGSNIYRMGIVTEVPAGATTVELRPNILQGLDDTYRMTKHQVAVASSLSTTQIAYDNS